MKKFLTVLEFELKNYLGSRSFVILTLLLAVFGAGLLCLPRFMDVSDFTGTGSEAAVAETTDQEEADGAEYDIEDFEKETVILYDAAGIAEPEVLEAYPDIEWVMAVSSREVEDAVEEQIAEEGYVITSENTYDYYIYDKGMFDRGSELFDEIMREFYRIRYCKEHNLDYEEVTNMYDVEITGNEQILHKDSTQNYWYSYALIMIVFFMIVMYGQMIAVAVTNEKSNRAIEVLVTSTTPNSLLFGKVIAGAISGVCQIGIILGAILVSYQCNRAVWGNKLDFLLKIPSEVLWTFALFGLGGYLFYAFLYGAMGALVSKTEDVSKSSSGLMIVIMVVYLFSLMQLTNPDGIIMKVFSFLPISSYSTMFIRIAMGTVATWEVIVSFLILVVSIVAAGIVGAKIYRLGTLRYGNRIKFSVVLKGLKSKEKE